MSKNKVKERCKKEEYAKFYYTSQRMFFNLKASRVILYCIAILPVILSLIPSVSAKYAFACSIISFCLSILNESLTSFLNEYKKKAIMEYQLYETGITGSDFSKIEYDRETTNELNELAIRKGLQPMRQQQELHDMAVPEDISDDYSYIYLCRREAATTKYLLSRIFYIYFSFLMFIAALFVAMIFLKTETIEYLTLIITFYPIVSPIIKACGKCKECMKDCTKICADIDNFFADGDTSLERLARMYYYVQNLEFEMMTNRPPIYNGFKKLFKKGVEDLEEGITVRFKSAIVELKGKAMMHKGIISQPKGKALITKVDYDMDKLTKIEKNKRQKNKAAKTDQAVAEAASALDVPKPAEVKQPAETKPPVEKPKPAAKKTEKKKKSNL